MKKKTLLVLIAVIIFGLTADIANAKLVACIGDSITYGSGIANRDRDSYPAQLGRMLQKFDNQWQVRNYGVSGATLLRNGDKPYVQQSAYTQALAAEPDAVIIKLGTNDSKPQNWALKEQFISDYLFLIDSFAELPSRPTIWICYPVPAFIDNFSIRESVIKNEVIPFVDQIAQLRDVIVIDLYTAMSDAADLFPDGIHPNAEGAGLMAQAIAPVSSPDFNADGIVDSADMTVIVDHWGQNYPLVDIGPAPFGDNIIDVKDLIVLSEYLFTEPGLIAHFKLDETEGLIARDSASLNDADLVGSPLWQPDAGIVDGALQLDGADDYLTTDFILNPTEESFSVFAWIKGGAPGQVILSQAGGANWLVADPSEGNLMTELKSTARAGKPLQSQTIITDDIWHRIGLVRDGSLRTLYVDGLVAAEDTQDALGGSDTGLYIGTGRAMEPGTFFSGLIDDIRIYNRPVTP
ncbi:MAG: GDSL-type esterase/lipase family protein [Sedimentisphaerales bacterium]|nr:GDSL-type esterase/lipase family protein [Sedimentisphaerales bacterium]